MFSRFGTKVYLFEILDNIVPNEEPEISHYLKEYLQDERFEIYTNAKISKIEKEGSEIKLNVIFNNNELSFKAEQLLIATGRRANTKNLGLE